MCSLGMTSEDDQDEKNESCSLKSTVLLFVGVVMLFVVLTIALGAHVLGTGSDKPPVKLQTPKWMLT